jgi:hypothetical protein
MNSIGVKRTGQNLLHPIMLWTVNALRAIGINFSAGWNCSANFVSPRGLQGGALKLLAKEISKEVHFRPLFSVLGIRSRPRLGNAQKVRTFYIYLSIDRPTWHAVGPEARRRP